MDQVISASHEAYNRIHGILGKINDIRCAGFILTFFGERGLFLRGGCLPRAFRLGRRDTGRSVRGRGSLCGLCKRRVSSQGIYKGTAAAQQKQYAKGACKKSFER
jgi:hypothetical protein